VGEFVGANSIRDGFMVFSGRARRGIIQPCPGPSFVTLQPEAELQREYFLGSRIAVAGQEGKFLVELLLAGVAGFKAYWPFLWFCLSNHSSTFLNGKTVYL